MQAQGLLDALSAGGADALVDREGLPERRDGDGWASFPRVALADALQRAGLLQRCADLAEDAVHKGVDKLKGHRVASGLLGLVMAECLAGWAGLVTVLAVTAVYSKDEGHQKKARRVRRDLLRRGRPGPRQSGD